MRTTSLVALFALTVGCGDDAGGGDEGGTTSTDETTSTSPSTTVTPSTSITTSETTETTEPGSSTGEDTDATGSSGATTGGGDAVEELWTFTHDGADNDADEVGGVAVDGEGNIYAAGTTTVDGDTRVWAIRLDPDGTEAWTFTGTDAGDADAIALLPGGDVVISGSIPVVDQQLDAMVARLAGDTGEQVWMQSYDGPGSGDDIAVSVAVDGAGDIVVAGQEDAAPDDSDVWIRKYDPDGAEVWTTIHAGDGGLDDAGFGIGVDGEDNVVVVGFADADAVAADGFVARYDSAGMEDWFQTIAIDEFQVMRGVAVDADGNIVVAGRVGADALSIFVAMYDATGAEQWTAMHLEAAGPDYGRAVALDAQGNAYVAGYVNEPGHFLDLWGRKYTADGQEVWSIAYRNEEAMLDDAGNAIAVDGDGNVIVAGFESVLLQSRNAWIRKYGQN